MLTDLDQIALDLVRKMRDIPAAHGLEQIQARQQCLILEALRSMTTKDWDRLNAIFDEALEKYPHSKFALHHLWNAAISTGPETYKPPPPPPLSRYAT
jgi:hypothetical protein